MQIIEVNRDNAEILFGYWNEIGKSIPYFYRTTYKSFLKSLFDDTFEGMTIFKNNNIFVATEDAKLRGLYNTAYLHFILLKQVRLLMILT